ncbi:hypothetical protein ACWEKT_13385 [Nocardia takedensis]
MEPTDPPFPEELADDLSRILGANLTPRDFRDRRDGARAPVLGLCAITPERTCRTACKLLERWTEVDAATHGHETLRGRAHLDIPTVTSGGRVVFTGVAVRPVTASTPHGVVGQLLPTIAALAGAIPSVVTLEAGQPPDQVPGWLARLRLLVGLDELSEPSEGDLGWLVGAHELAASVYVPDAAEDSLWAVVQQTLTDTVIEALRALDQYPGDPYVASSAQFADIIDPSRGATLDSHPEHDGAVLHVMRLPRRDSRKIHRGAVLRAPKRTS